MIGALPRVIADGDPILAALADGPRSTRGLARALRRRWSDVLAACRQLESERAIFRRAPRGRAAQWALMVRHVTYTADWPATFEEDVRQ